MDEDTLFYLYAKRGGLSPQQRAENVSRDITALGKRFNLHPDSVYIESTDIVTDLMYGDKVLVSFTDRTVCGKVVRATVWLRSGAR